MKNYIYQSFWFKNEIKKYFYTGSKFENHKAEDFIAASYFLAKEMATDKESFMPELVKKLEWLIGENNFIYDYWEFGDDDFSLYWHIKKDVYLEKMKLIQEWREFEGYQEIMDFEIHDPETYEDQPPQNTGFKGGLFHDDGTPIDISAIKIPDLCKKCKSFSFDFWEDDLLCNLNRADQKDSDTFECGAFEAI